MKIIINRSFSKRFKRNYPNDQSFCGFLGAFNSNEQALRNLRVMVQKATSHETTDISSDSKDSSKTNKSRDYSISNSTNITNTISKKLENSARRKLEQHDNDGKNHKNNISSGGAVSVSLARSNTDSNSIDTSYNN